MNVVLVGILGGRGGIQTHVRGLAAALLEEGHRVLVVTSAAVGPGDLGPLEELSGWEVALSGRGGLEALRRMPGVFRRMRRFRPDAAVLVGLGWAQTLLWAGLPRRTFKIFHEVMGGDRLLRWDSRDLVARAADGVVAQAPQVGEVFARTFGWQGPVETLPAFADPLERCGPMVEPPGGGRVRAAFLGRLVPHKRGAWLVRQWPRLADVIDELHVHGSGPEESAVRREIRTQRIGDRVFLHGPYPEGRALRDLLAGYDLVLLPTTGSEGAPLVLIEAMACGVPFVATAKGGIPMYAEGNPDCLVTEVRGKAFIDGVRGWAVRVRSGEVDRRRLLHHHRRNFSFVALKRRWLSYLTSHVSG